MTLLFVEMFVNCCERNVKNVCVIIMLNIVVDGFLKWNILQDML